MLLHVGLLGVALAANRTRVRTFAGMDAFVLLQIGALRKLFAADVARERFDHCVVQMTQEKMDYDEIDCFNPPPPILPIMREIRPKRLTRMRHLMLVDVRLLRELLATRFARVRFLAGVHHKVALQIGQLIEALQARLADERPLAGVDLLVLVQAALR